MLSRLLFLTLCLHVVSGSQVQEASKSMSRAAALRTLKGCATRPISLGCSEDTAAYLIKLYEDGDKTLLKPLLDAGLTSVGALSEILGDLLLKCAMEEATRVLGGPQNASKTGATYFVTIGGQY